MANDVVIFDFETLHTVPETVVLSLGMIVVDSQKDYTFQELIDSGMHIKIDVKSYPDFDGQLKNWKGLLKFKALLRCLSAEH